MCDVSGSRSVAATPDERVVTSVEEIDALPRGTILLTAGQNPAVKSHKDGLWWLPLHDRPMPAQLMIGFRVIYSPPVGDTTRTDEDFDSPPRCICKTVRGDESSCPWHGTTQPQPTELQERIDFLECEFENERDRANEHFDARMDAEAKVRDFVGAVAEIRALHRPDPEPGTPVDGDRCVVCTSCGDEWPCPTIAALDKAGC